MLTNMSHRFATFATALLLCLALSSCATSGKCGGDACAGDDAITKDLRDQIFNRPELGNSSISVQTIAGVVYLRGLVDTNVEKSTVESMARGIPGVKSVVNSIEMRNFSR
jgi:osmotically-inducible protein OsmY